MEIMKKSREVQQGKASLGAVHKAWSEHPLHRLLFEERIRREHMIEIFSEDYLAPLGNGLSSTDIRDYLIWKGEKHGSVQEWQKDKRRTLIIIKNEEETKTNNSRLPSSREGDLSSRSNLSNRPESSKTKTPGQRAYGPRKKTNPVREAEEEKI
jgi:hypothetical protein